MTGRVLSVALDWTGLCVVVGQRGACAYTPVNKLRGGSGREPADWADMCREGSQANADERRRPVSCVAMTCRQQSRARQQYACKARGGRPRRLLLLCMVNTIASSPGTYHGLSWAMLGWLLGCGRGRVADGLGLALLFGE